MLSPEGAYGTVEDEVPHSPASASENALRRAAQGATLQNYNNELVKCVDDLKEKREEVNKAILKDEEEKNKIQNDLRILTERLSRINESLARKIASRNEYDKTIAETEAAYMKILESSQTLLNVLKRETDNLLKKKQSSQRRGEADAPQVL